MKPHLELDESARDNAALYAIGALEPAEAEAYAAHLGSCAICRAQFERERRTAQRLALAVPEAEAAPALWRRVAERAFDSAADAKSPKAAGPNPAQVQPWKQWRNEAGTAPSAPLAIQHGGAAGAAEFLPTALPGISVRKLFVDEPNDRVTMLVRMQAGTAYPAHRHGGAEECYVLEGDLAIGTEASMRAGDYQRAERDSIHPVQSTKGGCLLLLVSSLHDQLLESA